MPATQCDFSEKILVRKVLKKYALVTDADVQ